MNATMTDLRVLLIEDNYLAAMALKSILEQLGCHVVVPAATIEDGVGLAGEEQFDAAFLDINIPGGTSYSIAEILVERRCSVIFVTGYSNPTMLPPALMDVPILRKPVDAAAIRRVLEQSLSLLPTRAGASP